MWFSALLPIGEFLIKEVSSWSSRRDALKSAKLEADVATFKAQAEIAAYKVKADIEWDLKWADQAGSSWKDEYLLVLWSIPLIALFLPFTRPYVEDGFNYLQLHAGANIWGWYMGGWGVIFSAVFGLKAAAAIMLPGQTGKLLTALGTIPDDIPDGIAAKAQSSIDAALKAGKAGLT